MSHENTDYDPTGGPSVEEELVAYLDGELDAPAERRIEQLLTSDPQVRLTLQKLEQTWDMLDDLGSDEVDASFTQTTLEMVAVEAEDEVRRVQRTPPRWRLLVHVGSIAMATLVGFLLVALLRPDPNRQLLEDLPVLENLDQYRQVGDIEFLRLLEKEGLFSGETDDGT